MKENNKIVFFLETNARLTGLQVTMLDVAAYISNYTEKEVYYVNNIFEEDVNRLGSSKVHVCDICETNFDDFHDATFVVPVNYLFFLLTRISNLNSNLCKIVLYFYDDLALKKLFNQSKVSCQRRSFISIIKGSKSYLFSDRKAFNAASNGFGCFYESYMPRTIPFDDRSFEATPCISSKEINIGYYGKINSKDVNAIMVLASNISRLNLNKPVNMHIIGEPSAFLKNDLSAFAPYIRFILPGDLVNDTLEQYLKSNVDLVLASNEYALKAASCNLPVVIPITSINKQHDNRYVFLNDVKGFQYGWDRHDLLATDGKMYNSYDILKKIYSKDEKIEISNACYDYYQKNVNVSKVAQKLLKTILKSSLTIKKISSAEFSLRQISLYNEFRAPNEAVSYSDFLAKYGRKHKLHIPSLKNFLIRLFKSVRDFFQRKKKYHHFMSQQKKFSGKLKRIQQKALTNGSIKVAFIVVFNSVFPTRPIFELMLKCPQFDPYIIIAPNVSRTHKYQMQLLDEAYNNLSAEYPDRVINGYDNITDEYLELKDDYNVIFFCNPYKHLVHPYHEIEYFQDKDVLTLYSSYGFAALKFWDEVINTDFYNYLWKACVETNSNLKHLKEKEIVKGYNGVVTGYIKVDKMAQITSESRDRKKILICPHHTVWGWKTLNISNFLTYKDFFIELPKLFPEVDFVFRPHPLLFPNLKLYKHWTQNEVDNYLEKLLESPNIIYDTSGEYFDKFINSDAMIHDCGSFIGEYLYTEKPCCYMMKSEEETMRGLVPLGQQCMQQYYHAFSKDDIINFIQNVVIKGDDPLKEQRESFVKEELKKNYPHAAETVVKMIKEELKLK